MTCDCDYIDFGDTVEHKMNTNVFGIVIGLAGSLVYVRVSPSLAVLAFHEWELRCIDGNEDEPLMTGAVATAAHGDGNVVHVDFTKQRKMRATTKTEGNC